MHEFSLVDALFDQIGDAARAHPGAQVRQVRVRIGALAGVEPQLFRSAFELLQVDRQCADAELELSFEDAAWRCGACGWRAEAGEPLQCGACGEPLALERGEGIYLDHLELEVPDV